MEMLSLILPLPLPLLTIVFYLCTIHGAWIIGGMQFLYLLYVYGIFLLHVRARARIFWLHYNSENLSSLWVPFRAMKFRRE